MKKVERSIKKQIKRKVGIQTVKPMKIMSNSSYRNLLRTSGKPKSVDVSLVTRNEIRTGKQEIIPEKTAEVPKILEDITKKTCVINQFAGIGDILFIEPIMRYYFQNGYNVILPVIKRYLDIQSNFPYIEVVDMNSYDIDYEERKIIKTDNLLVLPLRFSIPSMRQKYKMVDIDLEKWRELTWLRHRYKEDALKKRLGIENGEEYNLINKHFHSYDNGYRKIDVNNGLRNVEMESIWGYNLLDWSGVIESAINIHSVNTSIMYMLETLNLNANEIHIYSRNEKEFYKTKYLFKKNYIRHD